MSEIILTIQTMLIRTPGNLAYHIIIMFSIAWTLLISLSIHREYDQSQSRRLVWGVSALLTIRIILSISALLSAGGLLSYFPLHPLLDRVITALSLVIITWMWTAQKQSVFEDTTAAIMGFAALAFFIFSLILWDGQPANIPMNNTWLGISWDLMGMIIAAAGSLLVFVRKPRGWGYALSLLGIAAGGHFLQMAFPLNGENLPGIVRLAQMAYVPLLIALPLQFSPTALMDDPDLKDSIMLGRRKSSTFTELFESILALADESTPEERNQVICQAIAETMLSDICLVTAPARSDEDLYIYRGYDLIREQMIDSTFLKADKIRTINTALLEGKSIRMNSNRNSGEVAVVGDLFNLDDPGRLLAAPIKDQDGTPQMSVILLSPYSQRNWTRKDEENLLRICAALGKAGHPIQDGDQIGKTQPFLAGSFGDRYPGIDVGRLDAPEEDVDVSPEYVISLQEENKLLNRLITELEETVMELEGKQNVTQGELRLALEEIARLGDELSDILNTTMKERRAKQYSELDKTKLKSFSGIAEDLRRPMASILGYTELMLGESVGILGEMQRKFLDRIKISSILMEGILDDLLDASGGQSVPGISSKQMVKLPDVIDEAVKNIRGQFDEKAISLNLEISEDIPEIEANPDTLNKVFTRLLTNANLATPSGGTVTLSMTRHTSEDSQDFALIQIADQGNDFLVEEMSDGYSLESEHSRSISDTSQTRVDPSITKTLVEDHDGRIWENSEPDSGSTISILLPLDPASATGTGSNP